MAKTHLLYIASWTLVWTGGLISFVMAMDSEGKADAASIAYAVGGILVTTGLPILGVFLAIGVFAWRRGASLHCDCVSTMYSLSTRFPIEFDPQSRMFYLKSVDEVHAMALPNCLACGRKIDFCSAIATSGYERWLIATLAMCWAGGLLVAIAWFDGHWFPLDVLATGLFLGTSLWTVGLLSVAVLWIVLGCTREKRIQQRIAQSR